VVRHAIDFDANDADAADDARDIFVKFIFNGRGNEAAAVLRAEYDVIEQLCVRAGRRFRPCL
jgi:hypothetical protein